MQKYRLLISTLYGGDINGKGTSKVTLLPYFYFYKQKLWTARPLDHIHTLESKEIISCRGTQEI